jgi:CheY-like chemotaxis protein
MPVREPRPFILWVRVTLAVTLIALALLRLVVPGTEEIDATFLGIVVLALALLLVPWERVPWDRLGAFKAFGVEISLAEQPQVRGAVESLIDPRSLAVGKELRTRLEGALQFVASELETIRGSRVLWIDDNPNTVLGERRLLRALGIEVVQTTSSEQAKDLLGQDAHFDLLITDVQRDGESYREVQKLGVPDAYEGHEGANFVAGWLRRQPERFISHLPVLFYAAYPWAALIRHTAAARSASPGEGVGREPGSEGSIVMTDVCNTPDDLLKKSVTMLAQVKRHPIEVEIKPVKTPT